MSELFSPDPLSTAKFSQKAGPVQIKLTNDYLFRAMLQTNNRVLKGLIAALLRLEMDEIYSVEIRNPIILGEQIDQKTYILDILVCMNNNTMINLEMQVINEQNWKDRSLSYLCREFDQINRGEGYAAAKPVIQIGILNFTLFPEHPEFYAHYFLMNEETYYKYSDKFSLHVLDLTQIELATQQDKKNHLDYWARLFKARTWEELKAMAQKNDLIREAVSTIYTLTQDEKIRRECAAREEYYAKERQFKEVLAEKEQLVTEKEQLVTEKEQLATEKEQLVTEKEQLVTEKEQLVTEKEQLATEKNQLASELQAALVRIKELEKR